MTRLETGMVERSQAALEAVTLLNAAGFEVEDFEIDPEPESPKFDLDLTLSVGATERPLAILE